MEEVIGLILALGIPVALLLGGFFIGGFVESSHFRRLARQEQELSDIMVSDLKQIPGNWVASEPILVCGEAVVATDYFKVFVGALRKLFGGRIQAFEKLVERARREAIVRMLHQARRYGANAVWNVRVETSTIQGKQQNQSGGIEVLAYGTALKIGGSQPADVV